MQLTLQNTANLLATGLTQISALHRTVVGAAANPATVASTSATLEKNGVSTLTAASGLLAQGRIGLPAASYSNVNVSAIQQLVSINGLLSSGVNAKINQVITAARAVPALINIGSQLAPLGTAISSQVTQIAGGFSPQTAAVPLEITKLPAPGIQIPTGIGGATGAQAHLLVLTTVGGQSYYFNLHTCPFETLRRHTTYNVVAQERLQRRNAAQGVSLGGETLTLSGTVHASLGGAGQLDKLRAIGDSLQPLTLTAGYGRTLGQWCLVGIEETQGNHFKDGLPRTQEFSLEFMSYGADSQNV